MRKLNIIGNPIQSNTIDISENENLETLFIGGSAGIRLLDEQGVLIAEVPKTTSKIDSLDFSSNSKLSSLKITHSEISSLNTVGYNNLSATLSLDLSFNKLQTLNLSGFTNLESLNLVGNSNLECIEVNQNQLSNIPTTWIKDSIAEYNIDCK